MTKIVRSNSDEVKEMKASKSSTKGKPSEFHAPQFKMIRSADSYTKEELQEYVENARSEGKAEGYKEAEKRLSKPLNQILEAFEKEMTQLRKDLFKESEEDALELIKAIAKKVLRRELQLEPEALKQIVERAFDEMAKEKHIHLLVSRQDEELLKRAKPELIEKFQSIEEINIQVDNQIPEGSVVLRSAQKEVGAGVDDMVEHIFNQLIEKKDTPKETGDEDDKV